MDDNKIQEFVASCIGDPRESTNDSRKIHFLNMVAALESDINNYIMLEGNHVTSDAANKLKEVSDMLHKMKTFAMWSSID